VKARQAKPSRSKMAVFLCGAMLKSFSPLMRGYEEILQKEIK
jgi:hypothetical protein